MGWQWHQLDHTHIICISLQTDNHTSTSSLNFLQAGCSFRHSTNSVKALKAIEDLLLYVYRDLTLNAGDLWQWGTVWSELRWRRRGTAAASRWRHRHSACHVRRQAGPAARTRICLIFQGFYSAVSPSVHWHCWAAELHSAHTVILNR